MALEKARVQLLNPDTGAVVEEVDILSTASVISYVNNEKTVRDFRGIPAGTTFKEEDEISVKDVLDRILYPYQEMEIESIAGVDGKAVSQDTIIYKEKYYPVESYAYSAKVKVGNVSRLTFQLKRYNNITGDVTSIDSTVTVTPGSTYLYTQEVKDITNDTSLQLTINDGENITISPTVEFKFIYPVYVGYCDLSLITGIVDSGIGIDTQKATDYFNTLIANKSPLIEKRLLPVQDIQSIVLNDPIYSTQEYHPCILYPNTWHKVEAITDCNEDIITGSFYYNNQLSIKPDNIEVHKGQYTVYASMNPYNVQLAAAKAIVYRFELETGSINYGAVGVPTLTGFDPLNRHPLDLRLEANTYDELVDIQYKYDGMIVFVHDLQSYFRYDEKADMWINTNQELLFGGEIPSLDLGKSGDVYFNIATGHIYQKYKDLRWEDKGVLTVNLSDDILKSVDMWQSDKTYQPGEYVYWNGKYWKSQYETTSEPGTDNTWVETKPTIIQGPEGEPGEAATVEIVETLVTDNPDDADVINLGDKFHARLRFIVPRGPVGEAADPEILYQIQNTLTNHETTIETIQKQILNVNNDIDEVREDNINIKKDLNTAKSNINTINKNIENINEKDESQDTEITNIKTDISSIKEKNTSQDTEIENIKAKNTTQDNKIADIENKNQSQDTEINNIKTDISSIKEKNSAQDTEINSIKTKIEELESSSSSTIDSIAEDITNIESKNQSQDTEINNIKTDITDIKTKNSSQDTEISNIKSDINSINDKNNSQDIEINNIKSDISSISQKNTSQDTEITNIKNKNQSQDTEISNIKSSIEKLESSSSSSIDSIIEDITNIKNKNTSQDTEINNIKTDITDIKTTIEELESSSSDSINSITEDITNIESKNQSQDTEINNIKTILQTLDSSTSGNISSITEKLNAIDTKNNSQDTEISNIKSSIEELESLHSDSINSITEDITNIKTDISSIKEKNSSQDNEIENIKNKNASQDTEISNIKTKNDSQDTEINNIKTDINSIKEKNSVQDTEINNIKTDISSINQKNASQDTEINNIKTDISSITEKNSAQDTEINNIKTKNTSQDTEINNIKIDISSINQKNASQDTEIENIKAKNTAQDNKIAALENSISSINTKIDSILAEIENLKKIIPTGTIQEGATLKFINSNNTSLFETTVANGIPIMINGELDYSDAKTAYLETEEGTDYYIMKFQ